MHSSDFYAPHKKWRGYYVIPSVILSVYLSPRMGIYWVDMNWVLAIYSVSVQSKYPINLRHLLGILSRKINTVVPNKCPYVRTSVCVLAGTSIYSVSQCFHHSCPLNKSDTVRDIFTKLHINVKHYETTCRTHEP